MLSSLVLSLALLTSGAPAAPSSAATPACTQQAVAMEPPVASPVSIGDIGAASTCTASAQCGSYPDVSCMDNTNPAECHAYDTDCSTGFIGYVVCNGVRTDCPFDSCCSSICCDGESRTVPTGQCCIKDPCGGERFQEERCVNGQWEFYRLAGCEPTFECLAWPC